MEQRIHKVCCIKDRKEFKKGNLYLMTIVKLRKGYKCKVNIDTNSCYYLGFNTYFKYFIDLSEIRKRKLKKINSL